MMFINVFGWYWLICVVLMLLFIGMGTYIDIKQKKKTVGWKAIIGCMIVAGILIPIMIGFSIAVMMDNDGS